MNARKRLLMMSGAHLLNDGSANYLPGVLPVVLLALGASDSQAGILMGVLFIGQGLQPVIGWASDEVGGKAVTLGGLCGSTLAGALLGFAPNYWTMVILLVVLGLANSCFHPQALAGVRRLAAAGRGLSTSVFLIGGELGRGVWPFLAGLVVAKLGLHYLWLLAVPAVLCLPVLIASFPSLEPKPPGAQPIAWRRHAGPLGRVVIFTALRIMVVFSLVTFLALWWTHERGGGKIGGAALVATLYVVGILGNGAGGHFADRLGFRNIAMAASAATVVLMAAFLLVSGPLVWIVLALLGISLFATFPISIALGQDVLPENPSMGAGIALGLCNAIGAVAVMGLGLLVPRLGITGVLWVAAGISVLAAAAAVFLPMHSPAPAAVVDHEASEATLESEW